MACLAAAHRSIKNLNNASVGHDALLSPRSNALVSHRDHPICQESPRAAEMQGLASLFRVLRPSDPGINKSIALRIYPPTFPYLLTQSMKPAVIFQQTGLICEARIPVVSLETDSRFGVLAVPILPVQLVVRILLVRHLLSSPRTCQIPPLFHLDRAIAAPFHFPEFPFCVAITPRPKSVEPLPRVALFLINELRSSSFILEESSTDRRLCVVFTTS